MSIVGTACRQHARDVIFRVEIEGDQHTARYSFVRREFGSAWRTKISVDDHGGLALVSILASLYTSRDRLPTHIHIL